jgi:2-polyprenyl-6-hydroxyphenyl methylase / 3-demethylubiquinone-9 3-methyltransferase
MTGRSFITPDELFDLIRKAGLTPVDRKGFVFNPIAWTGRCPTGI